MTENSITDRAKPISFPTKLVYLQREKNKNSKPKIFLPHTSLKAKKTKYFQYVFHWKPKCFDWKYCWSASRDLLIHWLPFPQGAGKICYGMARWRTPILQRFSSLNEDISWGKIWWNETMLAIASIEVPQVPVLKCNDSLSELKLLFWLNCFAWSWALFKILIFPTVLNKKRVEKQTQIGTDFVFSPFPTLPQTTFTSKPDSRQRTPLLIPKQHHQAN